MQKYVNMADIIADPTPRAQSRAPTSEAPEHTPELALIELLFFAYRDFVSEPDALLAAYDFGRAHHRVLHFVNRHPGIRVADLLDILRITKQSLARVLKQLIDGGFVAQRPGPRDRRQRLLFTTESGRSLSQSLIEMQSRRIRGALDALPAEGQSNATAFLRGIIDVAEREKVARLIQY